MIEIIDLKLVQDKANFQLLGTFNNIVKYTISELSQCI